MANRLPDAVARFRIDVEKLADGNDMRLGLAISGGPDSLALLKLAAAAFPGRAAAATVDHGLRMESASEADSVARICASLQVPHRTLRPHWSAPPAANLQALAREARYAALSAWAVETDLPFVATAHHLDDQAETMLMRLARGAGLAGLSGIRASRVLPGGIRLIRPLLGFRKAELEAIVGGEGWTPAADPSNHDPAYDRTRARRLLSADQWFDPQRLADVASHLAEAEAALDWSARSLFAARCTVASDGSLQLEASAVPRELQRRLLVLALESLGATNLPGPKLARLLDTLRSGQCGTLADIVVRPVASAWRLSPAPPRRTG